VGKCPTWWSPCRIQVAPSVQRRKVWLTPTTGVSCSNAAKTRNLLKFAGVPQTNETISAASGPKFTIVRGHMEEILLLNKFFSDCWYVPWLRRYSPTELCDGAQMAVFGDFLGPALSAIRMLHISDLHSKSAPGAAPGFWRWGGLSPNYFWRSRSPSVPIPPRLPLLSHPSLPPSRPSIFPSLTLPSPPYCQPFPFLPLPLITASRSGEHYSSHSGSGRSPAAKRILV